MEYGIGHLQTKAVGVVTWKHGLGSVEHDPVCCNYTGNRVVDDNIKIEMVGIGVQQDLLHVLRKPEVIGPGGLVVRAAKIAGSFIVVGKMADAADAVLP